MDKTTIWTRIGEWMRNSRRSFGWDSDSPVQSVNAEGRPGFSTPHNGRENGEDPDDAPWYRVGGLRSRVLELAKESRRNAQLLDSLRGQVERQAEASQLAHRTIDRLATALSTIPDGIRSTADGISTIHRRVEADAAVLQQLKADVARLSKLGDAWSEATGTVARFVEESRKRDDAFAEGVEGMRHNVSQLIDASAAGLRSLDALRSEFRARWDDWTAANAAMAIRFTWLVSSAIALAVIAAALAVIALLR